MTGEVKDPKSEEEEEEEEGEGGGGWKTPGGGEVKYRLYKRGLSLYR
jgi:hypothetical protein